MPRDLVRVLLLRLLTTPVDRNIISLAGPRARDSDAEFPRHLLFSLGKMCIADIGMVAARLPGRMGVQIV